MILSQAPDARIVQVVQLLAQKKGVIDQVLYYVSTMWLFIVICSVNNIHKTDAS